MAEELWLDLGVDCDGLYGTGLDSLAAGVAHLAREKLDGAQALLPEVQLARLEKLLFLRTADEFWRDHVSAHEESLLNITLGYLSVKAAMAELSVRGFEAYELLRTRTIDAFLPRLLTFPMESITEGEGEEIGLSEDVHAILV
jgi:preprotein translocase subunit SecA